MSTGGSSPKSALAVMNPALVTPNATVTVAMPVDAPMHEGPGLIVRTRVEQQQQQRERSRDADRDGSSPSRANDTRSLTPRGSPITTRESKRAKSGVFTRLRRFGSKEGMPRVAITDDMVLLEEFLVTARNRNDLVVKLISLGKAVGDAAVLTRFVGAVADWERTEVKVEKNAKARKIVSCFVDSGSMFQIHVLPQAYVTELLAGNFKVLPEARIVVLAELANDPRVMGFVREAMD